MQMRAYRKDIADLLRAGKQDYARIRVEAVIREGLTLTGRCVLHVLHVLWRMTVAGCRLHLLRQP